jgi:hypothetical protein
VTGSALSGNKSLHSRIAEAYGPDGLGILAVSGVPSLTDLRQACLPLAQKLANLPAKELSAIEDAESFYSTGWSHGREKFQGRPDWAKGSFYANPLYDSVPFPSDLSESQVSSLHSHCECL